MKKRHPLCRNLLIPLMPPLTLLLLLGVTTARKSQGQDAIKTNKAINALRQVDKEGKGFAEAIPAANLLRKTEAEKIDVLHLMNSLSVINLQSTNGPDYRNSLR